MELVCRYHTSNFVSENSKFKILFYFLFLRTNQSWIYLLCENRNPIMIMLSMMKKDDHGKKETFSNISCDRILILLIHWNIYYMITYSTIWTLAILNLLEVGYSQTCLATCDGCWRSDYASCLLAQPLTLILLEDHTSEISNHLRNIGNHFRRYH